MTNWIHVRHERTGLEADIPANALNSYRRRGWAAKSHPDLGPVADDPNQLAFKYDDSDESASDVTDKETS